MDELAGSFGERTMAVSFVVWLLNVLFDVLVMFETTAVLVLPDILDVDVFKAAWVLFPAELEFTNVEVLLSIVELSLDAMVMF